MTAARALDGSQWVDIVAAELRKHQAGFFIHAIALVIDQDEANILPIHILEACDQLIGICVLRRSVYLMHDQLCVVGVGSDTIIKLSTTEHDHAFQEGTSATQFFIQQAASLVELGTHVGSISSTEVNFITARSLACD